MSSNNNYLIIKHVCENCGHDMDYGSIIDIDETKPTWDCPICDHINATYYYCIDCGEPITEADKQYYIGTGFCTHCFKDFFLDWDIVESQKAIDDLWEI